MVLVLNGLRSIVHCRVGSLEKAISSPLRYANVHCRVGSLEKCIEPYPRGT